jgi:hypothetical protein
MLQSLGVTRGITLGHLSLLALTAGCGGSVRSTGPPTGGIDAGGPSLGLGSLTDAGPRSLDVSIMPPAPVLCPGECVSLSAYASGGTPPYVYQWDHGLAADGGSVNVCPDATTTYAVTATDTSARPGEVGTPNATGSASVTVAIRGACLDAGASLGDAGGADSSGCGDGPLTFASGPAWPSYAGDLQGTDGGSIGGPALVCVNASTPPTCPPGALLYGPSGTGGWSAMLSLAPSAQWIWRGDVSLGAPADLQYAVFEKHFVLGANPTGSIQVAADDFVEVRVNGTTVGTNGSTTDVNLAAQAQATPATFDLGPFLRAGDNTITVVGQNPAGVLFGGTLGCR